MERAVTKAQTVLLLVILVGGAAGTYYIGQQELSKNNHPMNPTPTKSVSSAPTSTAAPSSSPTLTPILTQTPNENKSPTPTPTSALANADPVIAISVSILQPYNPGGPTIELILQNNATSPVVSLQAALSLSGHNYTYVFGNVSLDNMLLPCQDAAQTATSIGAGFETNQSYPMEITGTLQNGVAFDFVTPVTITQYSNQYLASGGNGNLELTLALEKTTYKLGEPVNLTLTIANISNQTINFVHTGLDFDFRVYNGTNNLVYQWSNFKAIAQFIAIVPFHAGESTSANFTWLQTCNFNVSVEGDPVSSGTYNIIGQTGPTYALQTNPIQIAIVK
jgi:hypothetical protein